jgi:hypothetical protein
MSSVAAVQRRIFATIFNKATTIANIYYIFVEEEIFIKFSITTCFRLLDILQAWMYIILKTNELLNKCVVIGE